ncbi:MAG: hypothetical protein R3D57_09695 [Hyphomicrobiaceae bacterium]
MRLLMILNLLMALSSAWAATADAAGTDAATPAAPDRYAQAILIYQALMALDQANATGNYSVLRDLAAPEFQAGHTAAALAESFAGYRRLNVALAPTVLFEPRLTAPASVTGAGQLRLTGYMPTRPLRIGFDISWRLVDGRWRLIGLAVTPTAAGR